MSDAAASDLSALPGGHPTHPPTRGHTERRGGSRRQHMQGTGCRDWHLLLIAPHGLLILCLFSLSLCVCVYPHIQLDVLVHRLITLLADTGDSKSAENRVSDANLACRKLAVSHPVLLLRFAQHTSQFSVQSNKLLNV